MSNKNKGSLRNQFVYSLRPGLTKLQGNITIGASGAVAADGYDFRGLNESTPLTLTGTGKYRIRFANDYLGLEQFSYAFSHSTCLDGYNVIVLDSSKVASDKYVDIQIVNSSSNAATVAASTKLYLEFSLKTSEQG